MKTNFKSKVSAVAGIAALCLVGTGYAAWTFSEEARKEAIGNANITEVQTSGELKVDHETFYLVIDQNFLGWTTEQNDTSKTISKLALTYKGSEHDSVNETINFNAQYTNGLASYIGISGGSFADTTMNYTGSEIINNYTLPTVSWVVGKKPTTQKAYDTMVAEIGGAKVTFTFEATVAE